MKIPRPKSYLTPNLKNQKTKTIPVEGTGFVGGKSVIVFLGECRHQLLCRMLETVYVENSEQFL